jgi:hypothetical protein
MRKILRLLLCVSGAVLGADAEEPIVFSPVGPTRDASVSWEEWRKTATRVTSNYGAEFMGHQHHGFPHSIQKSQSGNIYRIEVRQGEGRDSDRLKRHERAELGGVARYPYGTDVWVAYSLKVEKQPLLHEHQRVVIGQFHGHSGSPSMSVRLNQGKLQIQSLTNDRPDRPRGTSVTEHHESEVECDRWYGIVIRARFGTSRRAILQVWLDGRLIVDRQDFNLGYTTGTEVYWKFGVYRNTHPGIHALQFANMEVGTTSLRSRVEHPRKIVP